MTTGAINESTVAFVRDGWTFYDYRQKTWAGGDSFAGAAEDSPVRRVFQYYSSDYIDGILEPKIERIVRTRSPARLRRLTPNAYTANGKEMKQDWFSVSNGSATYTGAVLNEPEFHGFWDNNDDIALLSKVRDEIAGSSFNLAVSVGEISKTCAMIAENATALYRSIKQAKRGNFRKAFTALQDRRGARPLSMPKRTASSYLELKYGWGPLLNDVKQGAQFLGHTLNAPRVQRFIAVRNAGGIRNRSVDVPYWGLTNGGNVMMNLSHVESKRIIVSVSEVNVPSLVGLLDPLPVLWELTPYSFIADWFMPIGSWLSARGLSSSVKGSHVTTYRLMREMQYLWILNGSVSYSFVRRSERGAWKQFHLNRVVGNSIPLPPTPVFKPLSSVPSWSHAASAIALITNAFGSKARIRG